MSFNVEFSVVILAVTIAIIVTILFLVSTMTSWDIDDNAQLVGNSEDLKAAIQKIRNEKAFVLHLKGGKGELSTHLGRHGSISELMVYTRSKETFLFDMKLLGSEVFEAGMREILQNQPWVKLMYDCKRASDALFHLFNVKLSNVMDVQLLEVLNLEKHISAGENSGSMATKTLRSLKTSCEKFLKDSPFLERTNEIPPPPDHYKTILIMALYDTLKKDENLSLAREASERYTDYFRSYEIMPENKYYDHPFLPQNVIVCDLQTSGTKLVCSGCKKSFLAVHFGEDAVSKTERKCKMCKWIDVENPEVFWVDNVNYDVATAIEKLERKKMITAVLQPFRLERSNPLDIIFIGTEESEVYVFDITALGDHAFDLGLRRILESNDIIKLVFNCPDAADTLNVMHSVCLQNFFDVQILEVMHRKSLIENTDESPDLSIFRTKGFKNCIHKYIATKSKKASPFMKDDECLDRDYYEQIYGGQNVWAERPIREEIMKVWTASTLNIFSLFDSLKEAKDLKFLAAASERYVNHMRSCAILPPSKYLYHPFLPSDVLARTYTSYETGQLCVCCKKNLPSEDFGLLQDNGRLKCKICRIVDQDEPNVLWVDDKFTLMDAIEELKEEKTIAVICQKSTRQARSVPLDTIFIGTDDSKVYVFDVKLLGDAVFEAGLKDILEGSKCVKLMFDCRDSSDTLHKMHNVWLARVLDIQLLEVMFREKSEFKNDSAKTTRLNGLVRSIHTYIKKGCYTLRLDAEEFGDDEELRKQTARENWKAALTANLFSLFYKLVFGIDRDLIFKASQKFVDYLRSYENLPHKKYIYNQFLPMKILNDEVSSDEDEKQRCGGCEKHFVSMELKATKRANSVKMCDVCIEVDKGEPNIVWLDDVGDVAEAARDLQSEEYVSVVCQKHNLARTGPMDVIFIGTNDCTVYVFDITTMGRPAFDSGLRDVLESSTPVKLMFDCRDEADTLHKMHGTWLAHVVDVQLINVLSWRISPRNKMRNRDINSVHLLKGWKTCMRKIPRNSLKCSPNFYSTGNTRDGGRNVWEKRPLEERLVIYWAAGTLNMFTLFETLKTGVDMEMVSEASGRYVDYFRSYDALPVETEYIFHSCLPHNILTEATSLDLQCTGCRKLFAREEFNEDSIRSEIQKCRVCRWIFHNGGEFCKKN